MLYKIGGIFWLAVAVVAFVFGGVLNMATKDCEAVL